MRTFRDTFWERVAPAFPEGCDPYNSLDEVKRRDAALIAAMERAWKACIFAPSDAPELMLIGRGFVDAGREYHATLDRGHELLPYG